VTRDPDYIAQFPPEMIDWLDVAPVWALMAWALGVWGSLAGSLLLLLRSHWAVVAFAASLVGLAGTQAWQLTSDMPESMTTPASTAFGVVIWIVALALLWYSIRKRMRGVLR
jgi:mannose/fructose/N-acetylgalactosamine-specific phosphotransferase system component IID